MAPGIPEYWILNLPDRCLEVYREPDGAEYRSRRIYRGDETVSPLAAPAAAISIASLLGEE